MIAWDREQAATIGGIKRFRRDFGDRAAPGDVRLPLGPGVTALPFAEL